MTSDEFPDDFELITAMQSAKLRAEDFDRHQRAEAGLETGDGNRHNNKDKNKTMLAQSRSGLSETLTALQEALENPEYARAYKAVSDLLDRIESTTAKAIAATEQDIAEMEANAGRLPDGTLVFRDQHGNVLTADGEPVEPALAEGVIFPPGAVSYQDYQKRKQELDDLQIYQIDVLGSARDRLNDPDTPPTKQELDEWEQRIKEEAPEMLKSQLASNIQDANPELSDSLKVDKPNFL